MAPMPQPRSSRRVVGNDAKVGSCVLGSAFSRSSAGIVLPDGFCQQARQSRQPGNHPPMAAGLQRDFKQFVTNGFQPFNNGASASVTSSHVRNPPSVLCPSIHPRNMDGTDAKFISQTG